MNIKTYTLIVSLVLGLSGCLGPQNIDSWVAEKYKDTFPIPAETTTASSTQNYLTVEPLDSILNPDKASVTTKKEGSSSSLVISSKAHYVNLCKINESIPINNFKKTLLYYANRKHLKEKLNGRTLELTINTIPHVFSHEYHGSKTFGMGSEDLYIKPEKKALSVTYRILQGGTTVKTGNISVNNVDAVVDQTLTESSKAATIKYLDQYDASITAMAKTFLDKLMNEL